MRKDAEVVLGRVSVVQIARESSTKERAEGRRFRASIGRARRIFSTGSCTPITPVEQTKISRGARFSRREVSSTVRREARSPCVPVAQFALPAFTTTARMWPFDSTKCFLERVTGAATTRFCVKTAAAEAGTSLERIARSSAPVFFRPQAVAAKRNPLGSAASVGACVIKARSRSRFHRPNPAGQTPQAPCGRQRGKFHREHSWRQVLRLASKIPECHLQMRARTFLIRRAVVPSTKFSGAQLPSELFRQCHGPGEMESRDGRGNPLLPSREALDSMLRRATCLH